jgi:hypothetical protein
VVRGWAPRLLTPRNFEMQKVAMLHLDARGVGKVSDPGPPQHQENSRPLDLRRTRGARLSLLGISLIATSINKDYPFRIRECRKAPWE